MLLSHGVSQFVMTGLWQDTIGESRFQSPSLLVMQLTPLWHQTTLANSHARFFWVWYLPVQKTGTLEEDMEHIIKCDHRNKTHAIRFVCLFIKLLGPISSQKVGMWSFFSDEANEMKGYAYQHSHVFSPSSRTVSGITSTQKLTATRQVKVWQF